LCPVSTFRKYEIRTQLLQGRETGLLSHIRQYPQVLSPDGLGGSFRYFNIQCSFTQSEELPHLQLYRQGFLLHEVVASYLELYGEDEIEHVNGPTHPSCGGMVAATQKAKVGV